MRRFINILAGLSVTVIIVRTALVDVPQAFPGGEKVGTVLWQLSLAYISAWIFHALVVVLPKRSDQRLIFRVVEPLMHAAASQGFLVMLFTVAEEDYISNRPDREALHRACSKVDPNAQARSGVKKDRHGRIVPISWLEFGEQDMKQSEQALRNLQPFYPYLDADAIALLNEVGNHFVRILFSGASEYGPTADKDFLKFEKYLFDYWLLTNRLFEYKITQIAPLARGLA